MKVSVIIPAYNAENFLAGTIESALAQETDFPFEVVVLDDGSSDGTRDVMDSYGDRIRSIKQSNQGVSAARNNAIRAARGEYIALLDSDDYWKPGKLQAQVDLFESRPDENIGIVDTFTEIINHKGKVIEVLDRVKRGQAFKQLLAGNAINQPSSIMFPKRVFEDVGGFDSEVDGVEDYDFCLRVSHSYAIYTLEKIYCAWVHHEENTTRNFERQHAQSLKLRRKIRRMYPDDVDEAMYRRMVARSEAYFIPWFFRGGRYGRVLSMTARMLRNNPASIRHKSMLFAGLALLGPVGKRIHKAVGRDTRG